MGKKKKKKKKNRARVRNEGLMISSAPLTDERGEVFFFLEMEGRGGDVGV